MIEILPSLFIGDEADYENHVSRESGWNIVHACKDPYHRQALGYTGRAASKDHPEYLIAHRGHRLILNLVDVPNPNYIRKEIIDAAILFIHESLAKGKKTLVHCNQGGSRAPGIGMIYLVAYTDRLKEGNFEAAEREFLAIYPPYNPQNGIREFIRLNFSHYHSLRNLG